eukprot:TRINITY_DN1779_c2_g1_i1.p1 TRINITY_DN1779_c2_g1~~TRINITY_DN1779_c2_g1_i1.p1  ORF type:complete len:108 (+),score=3.79 TRINITY_DN1779_c2_g1_i1:260-583(+)
MSYFSGNPETGKRIVEIKAGQCHSLSKGAPNGIGPNLFGIVGRTSGTVPGFAYSKSNKDSGVVWSPEVLDQYLRNPRKFMPGNKMAFAGIRRDKDRHDVIAYLETLK